MNAHQLQPTLAIVPVSPVRLIAESCERLQRQKEERQPLKSPIAGMLKNGTYYTTAKAYDELGRLKKAFEPFKNFDIVDCYTFKLWTPAHTFGTKIIELPERTPQHHNLLPAKVGRKPIQCALQVGQTIHIRGDHAQCKIERIFAQFDETWVQMRHPFGVVTRKLSKLDGVT